jgi:hypothetical protein
MSSPPEVPASSPKSDALLDLAQTNCDRVWAEQSGSVPAEYPGPYAAPVNRDDLRYVGP